MGLRGHFRQLSCVRKVRHQSREAAYAALAATLGNRVERMAPYHCEFCGQWHNGHARIDDIRMHEPLPEDEPRCGCRHGADAHDEWWVVRRRCAFCPCMRSRQEVYRNEIRMLRRKQRTLSALLRAACRLYFPAMRQALRAQLAAVAQSLRDRNE